MTRLRIDGDELAARRLVAAGRADDHLAARNARRHRQRVQILRIHDARFPHRLACQRVQREQAAVDRGRDDHAVVERDAAIHVAAADHRTRGRLVDLRIPAPEFLAGARVEREDDAPGRDAVERVVPHQRRAFLVAAARAHHVRPGQAETLRVGGVDLLEGAVARFVLIAAVAEPGSGKRVVRGAGAAQHVPGHVCPDVGRHVRRRGPVAHTWRH